MLPKKERLSREAFNRFFSVGKRHHSPSVQLIYAPQSELHASVVVSKKVEKLAVNRNKLRRRMYDVVRIMHREKKLAGIFIFIMKKGAEKQTYEALTAEIRTLIEGAISRPDHRRSTHP